MGGPNSRHYVPKPSSEGASSAGRTQPPEKYLFAPFFAEETLVNLAQQEMYCPLSKEPDYKKTCVRVEKVMA